MAENSYQGNNGASLYSNNIAPCTPVEEQDVSSAITASLWNAASLWNGAGTASDLQRAILMSLAENQTSDQGIEAVTATKHEPLEARVRELLTMVAFELPLLYDPLGDTFVFVDPPAQQPEQDNDSYQRYTARYKAPMLMKKQFFMELGSNFFESVFGATYQHRVVRRRGLVGKLPDKVKYVVDLTPPVEDEQAVYLTEELSCSDGVRKWYQSCKRWRVSKSLVGGQEEYMLPRNEPTAGLLHPASQSALLPLEYSPVRHRSAIERVLSALQGIDPQLDSAPKVWTTFAVAKYFDITHSPLTDYIIRWLRASPNTYFLEVLPEISLRIADGLQCEDLCRDTFAILVGEEALGAVYRSRVPEFGNRLSVHGRKKEHLPESLKTRVEYASKAFLDRIHTEFMSLVDSDMHWIDNLPEFQKLSYLGPLPEDLELDLIKLKATLKAYVKGAIYTVLNTNFPYTRNLDAEIPGDDLFPRTSWEETWAKLIPRERILTRSFWSAFESCDLFRGPTNFHILPQLPECDLSTCGNADKAIHEGVDFDKVRNKDVEMLILPLEKWYIKRCNTLAEDPDDYFGKTSAGVDNTSSTALDEWSSSGFSLSVDFEHGSTKSLVPRDMDIGDDAEKGSRLAENGEDGIGIENGIPSDGPANKQDIHSGTFKKLQVQLATLDFFNLSVFCFQAEVYLKSLSSRMISPPDISIRTECLEAELTQTLLCLTNSEWKYLPMWAGGNDDGSGGVFNDDIPLSHDGFSTAGPHVVRENSPDADDSSTTENGFSVISHTGSSYLNTSMLNNDGFSDALPRGITVSDDSASSVTFDTDDVVSMTTIANDADHAVQETDRVVADMEEYGAGAAEKDKASVEVADSEETFDDIFGYSSDEEDDDGDTINGDDGSDGETNEAEGVGLD